MPLVVLVAAPEGGIRLSYTPAEAGATVTAVRLYTDPVRTGTPIFEGVPVLSGGVWTFTAGLDDGDYYSAFDVTDSTGTFTDRGDFFYVLGGEVFPNSTVVSAAEVRDHLELGDDRSKDAELLRFVATAIDMVEEKVGPLAPRTVTDVLSAGGPALVLRQSPVLAVTSLAPYEWGMAGTPVALVDTRLDGPAGLLHFRYPRGGVVEVTYVAGYARLPEGARMAVLELTRQRYSVSQGGYRPGYGDVDGEPNVSQRSGMWLSPDIMAMLAPFMRGMRVA